MQIHIFYTNEPSEPSQKQQSLPRSLKCKLGHCYLKSIISLEDAGRRRLVLTHDKLFLACLACLRRRRAKMEEQKRSKALPAKLGQSGNVSICFANLAAEIAVNVTLADSKFRLTAFPALGCRSHLDMSIGIWRLKHRRHGRTRGEDFHGADVGYPHHPRRVSQAYGGSSGKYISPVIQR